MKIPEEIKKEFNILVVDDDRKILELLLMVLSNEGYRVFVATSGEEALNRIQKEKIDIVITDLKMSKMDGLQLIINIKEINHLISIIVITAYPSLEIAEKALKEGVKDFITKPFGVAEVADAVNRVVRDKISQQKKKFRERHRHLSIIDEIIGVYDREYFLETLNCEIGRARKEAMRISLLLIEIEGLSNIYADREEEYASKIVEEVAQIIVENIRDIDIVGRIDEEEFGVIIINVEKQEILEIAKRIKTLIESRRFGEGIGEQENKLLVNFGISLYQGGKDILEEAHLALRKAKEEGKVV